MDGQLHRLSDAQLFEDLVYTLSKLDVNGSWLFRKSELIRFLCRLELIPFVCRRALLLPSAIISKYEGPERAGLARRVSKIQYPKRPRSRRATATMIAKFKNITQFWRSGIVRFLLEMATQ